MTHFTMKDMIAKGLVQGKDGTWSKAKPDAVPAKKHKYNARSKDVDGVHYDSQREYDFKVMLDWNKIPYNMKEEYMLQPGFVSAGEKIRPIKMIPDFTIYSRAGRIAVVDVKGLVLPDWRIKAKMLKHKLVFELKQDIPLYTPANKSEMAETIRKLLELIKISQGK